MSDSDTDDSDAAPWPFVPLVREAMSQGEPLEAFQAILEANEINRVGLYDVIYYALYSLRWRRVPEIRVAHEIIRLLAMHDPHVANMSDGDGCYLLHYACSGSTKPCKEIIKLLLELNPNAAHEQNIDGEIPMHHCV